MNWHLWPWCNYSCRFCFAHFANTQKVLQPPAAHRVLDALADAGTQKLTFAGGEPTLCRWLPDLVRYAKELGMTTMLVTNGTRVTDAFLDTTACSLDWLALSIDSSDEAVEARLGRGDGQHVQNTIEVAKRARQRGVRLKVNTVVTAENWKDDFHPVIRAIRPDRWKVFQMLVIEGENQQEAPALRVSAERFHAYLERHNDLSPIAEDNDAMTGSYIMLDPLGRFFQNFGGKHTVGRPLLEVGVGAALADVGWDAAKMVARGGIYEW